MKILITTDWYLPVINGVVTSVVNLERELRKKGHDVKILTLSGEHHSRKKDNVYYIKAINVGKIYPNARVSFFLHDKYLEEIEKWNPEIIHSQCEFTSFIFAKKIANKLNIPIVHTYHTIYEDYTHYFSPNEKIGKKAAAVFSRKIINQVQCVIAPTQKVRDLLIKYGIKKEKIYVVPTGIDLRDFHINLSCKEKDDRKRALGIPVNHKVLVAIGRLAKEKNLEQLFHYFSQLPRRDIHLLIVGDGPHRKALEKTIDKLGLEEKVIFTGMIPSKEVPYYYSLGDIFVSASNSETQGLTYIEALASGLPSVCKRDSCLENVIIDGQNGFQYNSFLSFQRAVDFILQSKENYAILSANAKSVSKQYSTEVFAGKVEKIYRKELYKTRDDNPGPMKKSILCHSK